MAVEASERLHLRVEVPDAGHDERPIQIQAGADRVTVTDAGDVILGLTADEADGLQHQLRGAERTVRHGGTR